MKLRRKLIFISIFAISVICIGLFGLTYGYIQTVITGNDTAKKTTLTSQVLRIEYDDGTASLFSNVDTYFSPGSEFVKDFTLTNKSSRELAFAITLDDLQNPFVRDDIVYELYVIEGEEKTLIGDGLFPKVSGELSTRKVLVLGKNASQSYSLVIKYLNSKENQIVDSGKVISGKVSIELDENKHKGVLIYGNSIQNGTPSPESPVEIESVGKKNLYPYKDGRYNALHNIDFIAKDGVITLKGETTAGAEADTVSAITFERLTNYVDYAVIAENQSILLEPGTYTFSADVENGSSSNNVFLVVGNVGQSRSGSVTGAQVINVNTTFTITESKYCMPVLYKYKTTNNAKISNIQLEKGSTKTDFIPYDKYSIPITVGSKNILKSVCTSRTVNGVAFTCNSDGSITMNGTNTGTSNIAFAVNGATALSYVTELNGGKVYTLSHGNKLPSGIWLQATYSEDGSGLYKTSPVSFTPKYTVNAALYIRFDVGVTANNITIYPQIEEGSVATSFATYSEPQSYSVILDEPLRKVGDCENCADYVDLYSGKVYRYVEEILLDGSENWSFGSVDLTNTRAIAIYNLAVKANPLSETNYSLSNRFVTKRSGVSSSDSEFIQIYDNSVFIRMAKTRLTNNSINDAKNWLSSNNVLVNYATSQYVLPSEEKIVSTVPKIDKDNVIKAQTSVQPSKIEFQS